MLKVMIADDDALARALVEAILDRHEGLQLVGAAEDTGRAIEVAADHQPDVVVLDWVMPGGGGPVAAREILLRSPDTKIVVLMSPEARGAEAEMLRAGVRTFVPKGSPPEELLRTIRAAVDP